MFVKIKLSPQSFMTARDLSANMARARYNRTIVIRKGVLKTVEHNTVYM